ncbi:hypothetical protein SEA_KEELAN_140 [Gordonia phage Keelan]|nr:hypothetical protein SEA_KEELAN_140 [Gordonia phage Keelan]
MLDAHQQKIRNPLDTEFISRIGTLIGLLVGCLIMWGIQDHVDFWTVLGVSAGMALWFTIIYLIGRSRGE